MAARASTAIPVDRLRVLREICLSDESLKSPCFAPSLSTFPPHPTFGLLQIKGSRVVSYQLGLHMLPSLQLKYRSKLISAGAFESLLTHSRICAAFIPANCLAFYTCELPSIVHSAAVQHECIRWRHVLLYCRVQHPFL